MPEDPHLIIGWREWLALPELGIPAIKAKIDTGARTSALHAYFVEPFIRDDVAWVRFGVHPLPRRQSLELICAAPVLDRRLVSDSGGHKEWRYVIETQLVLAEHQQRIELTLTNRDTMLFRMLLGRTALQGLRVDPQTSYLAGRELRRKYSRTKKKEF
jgi:hypothetical protein